MEEDHKKMQEKESPFPGVVFHNSIERFPEVLDSFKKKRKKKKKKSRHKRRSMRLVSHSSFSLDRISSRKSETGNLMTKRTTSSELPAQEMTPFKGKTKKTGLRARSDPIELSCRVGSSEHEAEEYAAVEGAYWISMSPRTRSETANDFLALLRQVRRGDLVQRLPAHVDVATHIKTNLYSQTITGRRFILKNPVTCTLRVSDSFIIEPDTCIIDGKNNVVERAKKCIITGPGHHAGVGPGIYSGDDNFIYGTGYTLVSGKNNRDSRGSPLEPGKH